MSDEPYLPYDPESVPASPEVPLSSKTENKEKVVWDAASLLFMGVSLLWLLTCIGIGCLIGCAILTPFLGIPLGIVAGVIVFVIWNTANGGATVVEMGCSSLIALFLVAILFPVFTQARAKRERAACINNLGTLGKAIRMYAEDNDRGLPLAAHWSDAIQSYIPEKPAEPFHCPADKERFSYAFHDGAASDLLRNFPKATTAKTVLLFESGAHTSNAHDTGTSLVSPGRHHGGNTFLFADGHTQFQRDGKVPFLAGEAPHGQ